MATPDDANIDSKSNLHPLLVDVVVENLFKYLSLENIINYRTVCKLWHRIGTKLLVNRIGEIKIKFGTNFSTDAPNPRKTIANFLQMEKQFSFKFTNFSTYYWNESNPKIPSNEQTTKLFDKYGHHIKTVTLNLHGKKSWTFLSDVLANKAPCLEQLHLIGQLEWRPVNKKLFHGTKKPELKLKTLTLHSEDEGDVPTFSKELLMDLFQSSPYLECLSVGLDCDNIPEEADRNHEVIILQTLSDSRNISNLKELYLSVGDTDIFNLLATSFKPSPLKEFHIQVVDMNVSMVSDINTFLYDHKDTWENLNLTFPCFDFVINLNVSFPKMNNLKALRIFEWCINEEELDYMEVPFGVFDFGKQFPNLVTLDLVEEPKSEGRTFFNLDEWFPENTTPLLTLKNLALPPIFDPAILRRIGRIFPNVQKLILVPLAPDVIKELWTIWPEIKSLSISIVPNRFDLASSLDSSFTGFSDASLKMLRSSQTWPADIECLRIYPSIKQLKKLRHLIIDNGSSFRYEKDLPNVDLTVKDETARLALADLKDLVFLHISAKRHKISLSCVRGLCTELELLETRKNSDEKLLHLVKYEWQKQMPSWSPCLYRYLPNYV